jgi:DNA-binding response OmpR family regulator
MPRILVVDDEPSILRLVTATLEPHGYEIITADNGLDALVSAKSKKPDLVLLDIMMPNMDGNEVRKRLHADAATKDIPIVHLSAVGDFQQQLSALEDGSADYITKPFDPKELRQRVADMLDPAKREQMKREHDRKAGKTHAIVDIMRRKREGQ